MAKKSKFYVVWKGREPGIYDNWEECRQQVFGFDGARYKSFPSKSEAVDAYRSGPSIEKKKTFSKGSINYHSISVDAACSGNPGLMEYRGVETKTGYEIFHLGPFNEATNNIGEFLAIVHALAILKKNADNRLVYTDSATAMAWVRKKKANTKLMRTTANKTVWDLLERAEIWLQNNSYQTRILKWETKIWGEIPADFGRK